MNDANIGVDDNREYLERGVQTEDALNVIQLGLATMSITSAERNSEEDFVSPGHIPSDADSLPETQGAYTHPSEMDQVDPATGVQGPEDSTYPGELVDDTLRVLKRQSSKQPRLPSTRTLKSISARVVSLPETAPVYTLKTSTEYIARRVVSNPDGLQGPHLDSDDLLESYEHVHAPRSRVRVETHGTDIPHTPSPPSSPDSVVIISNKPQLSEDFLQKNASKDELSCDYNKANGNSVVFLLLSCLTVVHRMDQLGKVAS
ncbi:hypothetical protein QCA50_009544 [Cerrena zonata]|uniref:Uncharacterized protein n=1 Tax=Cerrena zonata TaxID=2478898 RepID=A0AAW0G5T5_9APHY